MPKARITVRRKVKLDGAWKLVKVASNNGRLDFTKVTYKGKTISCSSGVFYLDFWDPGRRRVPVGEDPAAARRAVSTQRHVLELRRQGIDVDDAPELQSEKQQGERISAAVDAWVAHPPVRISRKSAAKYSNALRSFKAWSSAQRPPLTHIAQVDGKVMDRWMRHLRDEERLDSSTIRDKAIIVTVELRKRGAKIDLDEGDLPRKPKRVREYYSQETLEAFFSRCRPDEFLRYQTFLLSGIREAEAMFLGRENINAAQSTLGIRRKPELGFEIKNYQERDIPIPRWLTELLLEKARALPAGHRLLFGTTIGKPDKKMLDKLKRIAHRLKLNCGQCSGTHNNVPVTCATHPVCDRFNLHKFRHTFATNTLRDRLDVRTLQEWLGHANIDTTMIYVHALSPEMAQPQAENSTLSRMFARPAN